MSQSEADQEWKIEPALGKRDWWAAGYIYRGIPGTHQGQFVPVYHAPNVGGAGAYVDAMKEGCSRADAKARAAEWTRP
ncbi:hypothetical protein [Sphingomonas montanisoli]|uniref:hypothetical protein n=1 Tax=Sphingomonas montanisoli TaxID=2606412 RepID=UPI0011F3EE1E|nr:hypothetical protein [Sphingomonas montanisoli]